jgi:hypothetical protein
MLASLAASAYENGQSLGRLCVLILVAGIAYRLLIRWLGGTLTRRFRWGLAAFVVACVALLGGITLSSGDPELERARSEMLASCEASFGPNRDVCGCLIDEMVERKQMSQDALRAFARELDAVPQGARLACS